MLIITSTNPFFLLFPHRKSLAYFWPAQSIIDIVSRPQYQFPHTRKAIKWKFPEQVLKYFSFTGPFGVSVIKRMLQLMGSSKGGCRGGRGGQQHVQICSLYTHSHARIHTPSSHSLAHTQFCRLANENISRQGASSGQLIAALSTLKSNKLITKFH